MLPPLVRVEHAPISETQRLHDAHTAWARKMRDSWSDLSVLLCAAFLLSILMRGQPIAKQGKTILVQLVIIWYWTTTTWATEAKEIMQAFRTNENEPGFPMLGFWLSFMPQLVSAIIMAVGLYWRSGSSALRNFGVPFQSWGNCWLVAGTAFWFGQLFTVESLVFGSPALTFVVKAAEPLSTALLATIVLRKVFSWSLLFGIFAACFGVMVIALSADHPKGVNFASRPELAGMIFALLGNLGFSSRACVASKALLQLRVDAMEAYGMMTVVGLQVSFLPLIAYAVAGHMGYLPDSSFAVAMPFFDPRFSSRSWFFMCLSYALYQTASVLVLSCVPVESHALCVAMKHMMVAVFVSVLVHARLTRGSLLGMMITLFGVYLFVKSSKDSGGKDGKDKEGSAQVREPDGQTESEAEVQLICPQQGRGSTSFPVPTLIYGIVLSIAWLGTVSPTVFAVLGMRRAADL